MSTEYIKKSFFQGLHSLLGWYAIFGLLAATVAATNFVFALFNIEAASVLKTILVSYRDIIHGAIAWLLFPFKLQLPWFANDLLFLYFLVGGAFMRSRASEGHYEVNKLLSLKSALSALFFKKETGIGTSLSTGRLYLTYKHGPHWLRKTMDIVLWPRVARQYFTRPCVYRNEYNDSIQSFAPDYKPGGIKTFLYDRRLVFFIQVFCIIAAVLLVVILNGFSSSPLVPKF